MEVSRDDSKITENDGENRGDHISELCAELDIVLPDYVKLLLTFSGFDDIHSLSEITEKEISELEDFAKGEFFEIGTVEEVEMVYKSVYRKMFKKKIEEKSFKILPGHRIKLCSFVKKCSEKKKNMELKKALVETKNLRQGKTRHFRQNSETFSADSEENSKRMRMTQDNLSECSSFSEGRAERGQPMGKTDIEEQIKRTASKYIENLAKNTLDTNLEEKILKCSKNVKVEYKNDNLVNIFCPAEECRNISNVTTAFTKSGIKWVLSNFNKHFRKHHFMEAARGTDERTAKSSGCSRKMSQNLAQDTRQNSILSYVILDRQTDLSKSSVVDSSDTSRGGIGEESNITATQSKFHDSTTLPMTTSEEHTVTLVDEGDSVLTYENFGDVSVLDSALDVVGDADTFFDSSENYSEAITSVEKSRSKLKWKDNKYSRSARNIRKLETSFQWGQTTITDFCIIFDKIDKVIESNPTVKEKLGDEILLSKLVDKTDSSSLGSSSKNLFKLLADTAKKNINVKKNVKRFPEELKRFSLYVYLLGGRALYEIFHTNMEDAFPSLATLYRQLDENPSVMDGTVRINDLKSYLLKRNLPLHIFISEDQTALVQRIHYDPRTNKMIGFTPPISDKTGLPDTTKFQVNSVKDIEDAFNNEVICGNAMVVMAQPLAEGHPAFCLLLFGSNNKFKTEDVLRRWNYLYQEAKNVGITVEGFSSDGDTRCLKAMKINSELPSLSNSVYSPYFQMKYDLESQVNIQDTVHICTKLKTRLTNPKITLLMGRHIVSVTHLQSLIDVATKDKHLLCTSDLNNADKMNFKAIDKMSSPEVISMLREIPNSDATRQYLLITRYIIEAFLNKSTIIVDRIYKLWYSIFFLRIWRKWIQEQKYSLQKNFLTLNTYTCIELNGHGLLLMLEKCRQSGTKMFFPWLYSSQPCEKLFRQTRSMTSTYSTMVNFSLYDLLERINRIEALNTISSDLSGVVTFPREEEGRLGMSDYLEIAEFPEVPEVTDILKKAEACAMADAEKLGMSGNYTCLDVLMTPSELTVLDSVSDDDQENVVDDTCNEEYISENEITEIREDVSSFSTLENLNLKDYTDKAAKSDNSTSQYLTVKLNNEKTKKVRKSSLCWLFSQKSNRLPTDRIFRVRGPTQEHSAKNNNLVGKLSKICKNKKPNKNYKKGKSQSKHASTSKLSESETDTNEDYSSESETLSENFSDMECEAKENLAIMNIEPIIELEQYYAVFYDTAWYIGRIMKFNENKNKNRYTIKFLEGKLGSFSWPKRDDIQEVERKFIFFGPINLGQAYPFQLSRNDLIKIRNKYKRLKHWN